MYLGKMMNGVYRCNKCGTHDINNIGITKDGGNQTICVNCRAVLVKKNRCNKGVENG
jgi:predicted SprT family Zn-dependent metalloprotease